MPETVDKEIEINAEYKKIDDEVHYRCPAATWRYKGETSWRGSTSVWTPFSELPRQYEDDIDDELGSA